MDLKNARAVLVALQLKTFTNAKADEEHTREYQDQHGLSQDSGLYSKFKLKPESLESIRKLRSKIRNWHYEFTLKWEDGRQLLPANQFERYNTELAEWRRLYTAEIEKFLLTYPSLVEARKIDLNGTFDPSDYPDVDTMRHMFTCLALFYPIPDESHVNAKLGSAVAEAMRSSVGAGNDERLEEAMADLWTRLLTPINHMAQKLKDPDATFRDSLVENIQAIIKEIPNYDFLKHPDVAVALKTAQAELAAVTPEALRTDKATRSSVAKAAAKLVKTYGTQGGRKLSLS